MRGLISKSFTRGLLSSLRIVFFFCLTLIFLFSFFSSSVSADDCSELQSLLEAHYQSVQRENYDDYMSIMDADYINNYLVDDPVIYEAYVKAYFEVYDLKSYKITIEKCDSYNDEGIIFFNLKSTVEAESKSFDLDQDFVANFHKNNYDVWKLQFVMRRDLFFMHQDQVFFLSYFNATKELIDEELTTDEEYLDYLKEITNQEKEFQNNGGDINAVFGRGSGGSRSHNWPLIIVAAVLLLLFIFLKDKKRRERTLFIIKRFAKNAYVKAKPRVIKAYDRGKELGKDAYVKAKPRVIKAYDRGKELGKDAYVNSKELIKKMNDKRKNSQAGEKKS